MPHPKTHGSMLHDRLKQNKTNKQENLWIYFGTIYGVIYLLGIDIWREESTVSPLYLHIHEFNQRMENIWKKKILWSSRKQTWIFHSSSIIYIALTLYLGFPGGTDSKESDCSAWDMGLIPGSGRSPGEGSGHPFQDSCLENPMDRGAWWAAVHGIAKSWMRLSD